MLWRNYVFRRDQAVHAFWDDLFQERKSRVVIIAGCGFDTRVTNVLRQFRDASIKGAYDLASCKLVLIELSGYELDDDLVEQTKENCDELQRAFEFADVEMISMVLSGAAAEFRSAHAIQKGIRDVFAHLDECTDVILDISSLPRMVYLALMTALLDRLVPAPSASNALSQANVNFQILVGEDSALDSKIHSEDPSEDLVLIPGFGGGIKVESMAEWPVVWLPLLGEGRVPQFEKILGLAEIPSDAEICPVVPHPSRNPRRGDNLLLEYRSALFDARETPLGNVLYVHESNPFEAYRQLRGAIVRYRESLRFLGGCRILLTPLASKLTTVAAGLAAFELKPPQANPDYALGIPYAAPTRYSAKREDLKASKAVLSALLLTGQAYASG